MSFLISTLVTAVSEPKVAVSGDNVPRCTVCHEVATKFDDVSSLKEYGISQLCQNCQDNVF